MFKEFKHNRWQIAYRMKGMKQFKLLPNPEWGWMADPFPVVYQGSLYIFAEAFLYKSERNGVIAYCKFENGTFSEWTVSMDRHWHLSYPNVFVINDKLYMCPETHQNDEISVYELEAFPNQWKKVKVLVTNVDCVDTTFCRYKGEDYMFTFQPDIRRYEGTLYLYRILGREVSDPQILSKDISSARPGGNIIHKEGKAFRVSQNGLPEYGSGLVFSEIDSMYPVYKEHEVRRVYPQDVPGEWKRKFVGVHTYNQIDEIEVIDLKYEQYSLIERLAQKRVRKVFLNKY